MTEQELQAIESEDRAVVAARLNIVDHAWLGRHIPALVAEVRRLQGLLADCYRASGADPDGNEDWRLAEQAVSAVREARADWERDGEHADAKIARLQGLIKQAEWSDGTYRTCPWCEDLDIAGHKPDCPAFGSGA